MPDLSKMLGDGYSDDDEGDIVVPAPAEAPTSRPAPPGPAWANEDRLDAAFEGWTPGPAADAPAAERQLFSAPTDTRPLDADLAAALSEALADAPVNVTVDEPVPDHGLAPLPWAPPDPSTAVGYDAHAMVEEAAPVTSVAFTELEPEPVAAPVAAEPARPWQRSDDDVLPGKGSGGGGRRGVKLNFSLPSLPALRRKAS